MTLGINRKVILLTFSIILFFGCTLGYYIIRYQTHILKLELDDRIDALMDNLSITCEYPILISDKEAIARMTKSVLSQRDIVSCRIEDISGNFFYEEKLKDAGDVNILSKTVVVEKNADGVDEDLIFGTSKGAREVIGTIYLGISNLSLNQRVNNIKFVIAISIFVTIFTTCLTIYFLLRRVLGRPVSKLVKATENISKGNLSEKVQIATKDEIGVLAASFNRMTENLLETTVSRDYVDNIIRNMKESLIVVSPDGTIRTVNQNTLEILGYKEGEVLNQSVDMIFEDPKNFFQLSEDGQLTKDGIVQKREIHYIRKDGSIIPILFSASVMCNADGKIQGTVCLGMDITERKRSEKEMQNSLREKEVLLQEIHHRVKNNMQVIMSLLSLQSQYVKDQNVIEMFQQCQDRVNSMAIIHDNIYRSNNLSSIKLKNYVEDLANDLFVSYKINTGNIRLKLDIEDFSLGIDTSIPCGLIINELVSNSLKYAFPENKDGNIEIVIHKISNGEIELLFSDNGIGLPDMFDFKNSSGFGFRIIVDLVEFKLMGKIEQIQDIGTKFQIRFNELVYKKRI